MMICRIRAHRPPGRSDPRHAPAPVAAAGGNGDRQGRDALTRERDASPGSSTARREQRTRLKRDLAALKAEFGDGRRTSIEEVAPAREIDWSAMIEKEPITVILSQRGWIRAMKGHLALDQVGDLKWREGDGPFIQFHAQTTDRLALFAQRPRLHAGGDKLPSARGFGEPVRLFIDLDAEVEIVQLLVVRPECGCCSRRPTARVPRPRRIDARRDAQGQAAGQPPRRRPWRWCGPCPKARTPSRWSAKTASCWFPSCRAARARRAAKG